MVVNDEIAGNTGTESLQHIHSPESRKRTLRTVGDILWKSQEREVAYNPNDPQDD